MKSGARDVSKVSDAGFRLEELNGIEIIEDGVMHVEGGQGNAAAGPGDEEFMFTPGDFDGGGPWQFEVRGIGGLGKTDEIAGAVADQWHGEVMEGSGDDFTETFGVWRAEFREAVSGPEIEEIGESAFAGEDSAFGVAVPAVGAAAENSFEQSFLRQCESL